MGAGKKSGCSIRAPDEGPGLELTVFGEEAVDCRLRIDDRMKAAVLQAPALKP